MKRIIASLSKINSFVKRHGRGQKAFIALIVLITALPYKILEVNSFPGSADLFRPHPTISISNFPSHAENTSFQIESSSSALHKIIHQYSLPYYVTPTQKKAFNLQKIIQKLGFYTNHKDKVNKRFPLKNPDETTERMRNDFNTTITPNVSLCIDNATRLKRQLEGIFHVRETPTSTTIPILSSTKKPTVAENNRIQIVNKIINANNFQTPNNVTKTTKIETRKKKFPKLFNFSPTSNKSQIENSPTPNPLFSGNRNLTVEIVEISRKTRINHNSNNQNEEKSPIELTNLNTTTSNSPSLQEESSLLKSTPIYRSIRPRLRLKRIRQPGPPKNINDSEVLEGHQKHTISSAPIEARVNKKTSSTEEVITNQKIYNKPVDVKVATFQEQIPYNDREITEADLKDYLEGHSTFGAKDNFKHTVNRNVSGFIPHHNPSPQSSHGVYKRTPQSSSSQNGQVQPRRRNSERNNNVNIIKADITKHQGYQNPRMTIYTASGVKYAPNSEEDEKDKNIYEYSGNRNRIIDPKKNGNKGGFGAQEPKNPHFDELYRRGHPAIAKPPPTEIYQSHPLGEPYGAGQEAELYENPFRPDPFSEQVPLKFDPASDTFYGNPKPDKDKKLAQSNRPEPVRVENQSPEYQEPENNRDYDNRQTTVQPTRGVDKRIGELEDDQRYYNPKSSYGSNPNRDREYNYRPTGDSGGNRDPYIKDYVSLDNNFEQLPRPSAEDENFSSLIPPEAIDYDDGDGRYYGGQDRNNDNGYNEDDDRNNRDRSTSSYERDDRPTTERARDRQRYNQNARDEDQNEERSRVQKSGNRDSNQGRNEQPKREPNVGYVNDDYNAQQGEGPEDYDSSYIEELSPFEEEIKRLQENDRRGIGQTETETPSSVTTRDPPLVITSPGPAVSYQSERSIERPTPSTTPYHPSGDDRNEGDEEEHKQNVRPESEEDRRNEDDRTNEEERPSEGDRPSDKETTTEGNKDEETEEEEEPEENDDRNEGTTESKRDERDNEDDGKESKEEESPTEQRGVKIIETEETKRIRKEDKPKDPKQDNAGNLDEDISKIEKEFAN